MTRTVKLAYPLGEYELGAVVELPIEQADRLVFEGRATYAAPVPAKKTKE